MTMEQECVFSVRTKGDAPPQGKVRVYFTCHPEDFEGCFEQLCRTVFAFEPRDCDIYYTPDMTAVIPEDERKLFLAEMNLFFIPVSQTLMTTPSRAMDADLPFAVEHNIPILVLAVPYSYDTMLVRHLYDILVDGKPASPFALIGHRAFAKYCIGNLQGALEDFQTIYALRRKLHGEEHPYTFYSMSDLADCYGELGDRKKELDLRERAYEGLCKIFGEEHPRTLKALNDLAHAHGRSGSHAKKLELLEALYVLRSQTLGETHYHTLYTLYDLAYVKYEMGDAKGAVAICGRILRADEELPFGLIRNLISLYEQLGRPDMADALRRWLAYLSEQ